ncbi:hypothetical protein [Streptomyces sp. NBC_00207]|uniref:hypothetical protein n=1 Tax=unclassified Streptomyces TaxID=2593676 RepID=UPI0028889A32|nr:hypothetical protein [Streptomyces sp. DSM 41633]
MTDHEHARPAVVAVILNEAAKEAAMMGPEVADALERLRGELEEHPLIGNLRGGGDGELVFWYPMTVGAREFTVPYVYVPESVPPVLTVGRPVPKDLM